MPCLITALTRYVIKKASRKKNKQQNKQKQKVHGSNLISKFKSSRWQRQNATETLTIHNYFFVTTQQMWNLIDETG